MVCESTYGDSLHEKTDIKEVLGEEIKKTAARGGTVLIPSFAVGRTQTILYYLYHLKKDNLIPNVPIYVDSPMATNATELLCHYHRELRLSEKYCSDICSVASYIRSSKKHKLRTYRNAKGHCFS